MKNRFTAPNFRHRCKPLLSVVFMIFLSTSWLASCHRSSSSSIDIIGSTTVTPLMEHLVAVYEAEHQVRFDIQSLGSTMGVISVRDGQTPIGMSSRSLTQDEIDAGVIAHHIATEALAVAVNKENPVVNLTHEQIHDIFSGKITNWKEVGGFDKPIVVVSREAGSGARSTFESIMSLQEQKESLVDNAPLLIVGDGTGQVRANIASKIEAISYISLAVVDGVYVKAVSLDGIDASQEHIRDGIYLLSEPLYLLTREDSPNVVQDFVAWVLSEEGQAEVVRFGSVSVRTK